MRIQKKGGSYNDLISNYNLYYFTIDNLSSDKFYNKINRLIKKEKKLEI